MTAAAGRLGRNARHSSLGRVCNGCGLGTTVGGWVYAVSSEDKEKNCIKRTLGVFRTPVGHSGTAPSSRLTINPTDHQQPAAVKGSSSLMSLERQGKGDHNCTHSK